MNDGYMKPISGADEDQPGFIAEFLLGEFERATGSTATDTQRDRILRSVSTTERSLERHDTLIDLREPATPGVSTPRRGVTDIAVGDIEAVDRSRGLGGTLALAAAICLIAGLAFVMLRPGSETLPVLTADAPLSAGQSDETAAPADPASRVEGSPLDTDSLNWLSASWLPTADADGFPIVEVEWETAVDVRLGLTEPAAGCVHLGSIPLVSDDVSQATVTVGVDNLDELVLVRAQQVEGCVPNDALELVSVLGPLSAVAGEPPARLSG